MERERQPSTPPSFGRIDDVDVWLLEDSAVDGEVARATLPNARVRLFTDGAHLLEEVARARLPDVIVLDWELGDLPGIEVCRFLRRSHDSLSLPIIMVTSHREESYVLEAFGAGANDYIIKPYVRGEFAARVLAAARARRIYTTLLDTHASLEHERARTAESEERHSALAQSGVIGIIECDLRGRLLDVNDAYVAMLGRTRTQLLTEHAAPDHGPLDARALRELVEHGVTAPHERELVRGDGEPVVVRVAAARLRGRSDRCVGYVLDVTHERQVEADRARLYAAERRARADAELASRMKDDFLAIVSHELRTPLNAMLGWASILQTRLEHDAQAAKPLEVIQRNARLQAKLIDDILDVSRIISGKVRLDARELDLRTVIQQAMDATAQAAEAKALVIELRLDPSMPTVIGDPDRLQQVVWNLLSNAVKYTPRGGQVSVRTRVELRDVVIDVVDSGSGIAPENLAAIFERFHQIDGSTTRAHGGLGLGLAIVRHLVEMHGGTVSATSPGIGQGATFSVRLGVHAAISAVPAGREPAPPSTVEPEPKRAPASLLGVVVVVVDDDLDSRTFACTALRLAGAEVIECSDVVEAIAAVERLRPDVLVSDISMPGQDGYALIAQVRRLPATRGGATPSIALTAHAREHDVERCLVAGFDSHLAKPLEADELVRRVASVRASQRADDALGHLGE